MKERKSSTQLGFEISSDDRFIVPESIFDKNGHIVSFLSGRRLWEQRPKGNGIFVEMEEEYNLSWFNTSNWQIVNESCKPQKVAALLVVCDTGSFDEAFLPLDVMKKEAAFYVFERTVGKADKNPRLQALQGLGMVETSVLNSSLPGFCVWEGRVEKARKARNPIDLLDKERRPRAYNFACHLWKKMSADYRRFGFYVVPDPNSPIVLRLKSSKNPPDDFLRLGMGWGVEIKNLSCGCHARKDLNGNVDWIYS